MAKQKQKPKEIECKDCKYSTLFNKQIYCKTKMKDDNTFQKYALVEKVLDCSYFKNKFSLV